MRIGLAVLLGIALACAPEPESPDGPPPDPAVAAAHADALAVEQANLLNLGLGAAVVARTGELTLENSAIRAIDGDPESPWASPPNDVDQTLTFSLPAPARIDRAGFRTSPSLMTRTKAVSIETSTDGQTYTPLVTAQLEQSLKPQLFGNGAETARFIRVRTTEGGTRLASLQSVILHGTWLAPLSALPLSGCFTVNEAPARFNENAGRVYGRVGEGSAQSVDGGLEGATYRFAWTRGEEWGYALITLTPDGAHLSGVTWHEEAAAHSFGTSWFGERRTCAAAGPVPDPDAVVRTFLRRSGWYPLFSLRFAPDDTLVEPVSLGGLHIVSVVQRTVPGHRVRLVARVYGEATPQVAKARAEARLQSLRTALSRQGVDVGRIDFVAAGSEAPRRPVDIETMRRLYGVVEIELPSESRSAF